MGLTVTGYSAERIGDSISDIKQWVGMEGLIAQITEVCGPPNGKKWQCPAATHVERKHPNLNVFDSDKGPKWQCHACDAGGDVFDWMTMFGGARDEHHAAQLLGYKLGRGEPSGDPTRQTKKAPTPPPPPPKPAVPEAWRNAEWQAEVRRVQGLAEANLWDPEVGRDARRWIKGRGLALETAWKFRLGFLPQDLYSRRLARLAVGGVPKSTMLPRGIVFPLLAPGSSYARPIRFEPGRQPDPDDEPYEPPTYVGINVRRLAEDVSAPLPSGMAKYKVFKETARGYGYPYPDLSGHCFPPVGGVSQYPPALILEGEPDALLAEELCGHLGYCLTIGSATQEPKTETLMALAKCRKWIVVKDRDGSGTAALEAWMDLADELDGENGDRVEPLLVPHGKDFGEFVNGGGDAPGLISGRISAFAGQLRARD